MKLHNRHFIPKESFPKLGHSGVDYKLRDGLSSSKHYCLFPWPGIEQSTFMYILMSSQMRGDQVTPSRYHNWQVATQGR